MHIRWLLYGLATVNMVTFLAYGLDKWKARRNRWRIPEAVLLWMAVLGGSPAALVAMHLFHHKTLHKKFRYGVPTILFIHIIVAVYLYFVL